MKISFKVTAISACILFTGLWSCAQVPPAGTPPPPNVANAPALMPPPPARAGQPGPPVAGSQPAEGLKQLTALTGKVTAYLSNDHYEYDGLTLQTSGNAISVKFPAHLGEQLMKTAPKGSTISVNGFYENSPLGANEFHLVNANAGSTLITDATAALPATPPAEEQKSFTGTISDFRRTPDGMVNGIVLGNKQVVELPPPAAEQLKSLLKAGEKISGNGIKVTPRAGVVMTQDLQAIRPQTLTVNGQTYMVR